MNVKQTGEINEKDIEPMSSELLLLPTQDLHNTSQSTFQHESCTSSSRNYRQLTVAERERDFCTVKSPMIGFPFPRD